MKGTQEDLGIEHEHRKHTIFTWDDVIQRSNAIAVPDGDLPNLMRTLKSNVQKSALRFEEQKLKSRGARGSFSDPGRREVIKAYNHSRAAPSRPEILCRFYGQTETYTAEKFAKRSGEVKAQYAAGGRRRSSKSADTATETRSGWESSVDAAAKAKWNTRAQQAERMFAGAEEGTYYRQPAQSDSNPLQTEHTHCEAMRFEAGDHLTIVGLNVARDEGLMQHTALVAQAYMPHFDKVYMHEDTVKQQDLENRQQKRQFRHRRRRK